MTFVTFASVCLLSFAARASRNISKSNCGRRNKWRCSSQPKRSGKQWLKLNDTQQFLFPCVTRLQAACPHAAGFFRRIYMKSLDTKLTEIKANPSSRAFIIADAKDADMAFGVRSFGPR